MPTHTNPLPRHITHTLCLLLLTIYPTWSKPSKRDKTLLNAAMDAKTKKVAELLTHKPNIEIKDPTLGFTPLQWAIYHNDLTMVNHLIQAGADTATQDHIGYTPLHWATYGGKTPIVIILLQANAHADAHHNPMRITPLHIAVTHNHHDIVQHLINHNANPNTPDKHGETPLTLAQHNNNTPLLLLLTRNQPKKHPNPPPNHNTLPPTKRTNIQQNHTLTPTKPTDTLPLIQPAKIGKNHTPPLTSTKKTQPIPTPSQRPNTLTPTLFIILLGSGGLLILYKQPTHTPQPIKKHTPTTPPKP